MSELDPPEYAPDAPPPEEPNLDELLGQEGEVEERGDTGQEDPISDAEDAADRLDTLEQSLDFLGERVDEMERVLPDIHDPVFPARLTGFTSGTGGTWNECFASGTTIVPVASPLRYASAASNGCAAFGLSETDFISVEQTMDDGSREVAVFPGVVDVYLTETSSGVYDGYLDAGKTVKVFGGQSGPAGATKGLARLVGKIWRMVGTLSGTFIGAGSLTGHSGTGSTYWIYAATLPSGATANAYNLCEWNGTAPGIIAGSPGSLGINVDASGTLTGGSCVVKPIGNKPVLLFWDSANSRVCFDVANSAQ